MSAPIQLTELEWRLAQPDGEELKSLYLERLAQRSIQLKIDIRQLLSPQEHKKLAAVLAATESAHRVLTAWPTGAKLQNLPYGQNDPSQLNMTHFFRSN